MVLFACSENLLKQICTEMSLFVYNCVLIGGANLIFKEIFDNHPIHENKHQTFLGDKLK